MTQSVYSSTANISDAGASFADRLQVLIGDTNVSAFARKVGLSESLIRKYLKGSEPSLSRADQIARKANVSLEWLATGCGYQYRQAEIVDQPALIKADELTKKVTEEHNYPMRYIERMTLLVSIYQYLRTNKKADGYFDEQSVLQFAEHALMDLMNAYDNIRKKREEGEKQTREG